MDKFKKLFTTSASDDGRQNLDHFLKHASKPNKVDTKKFAKAVVQEYGETLVLLGKE